MSDVALPDQAAAIEVAAQIGFGIARRAFREGGRCTWLDAIPVAPGRNPAVSQMCGPDLYGGTSGIGWFLAELAARVPDTLLRATARAALRQSAARALDHPAVGAHGFYGGRAGIGAGLVLAGIRLGDEEAAVAGRTLLAALPLDASTPDGTDLVSGLAGTALALAIAGDALKDARLIERAATIAATLIRLGTWREEKRLSWASMPGTRADLTGFAHGTAGIAHALLVVDALAPDPALRAAAAAALAYEDAAYDPAHGGWPDYRVLPGYPPERIFYPVAWCHGAAGIAQMRLAARRRGLGGLAALDAGMAATAAEAARMLALPGMDLTLCHGLLGLADALIDARREARSEGAETLAAILRHAIAAFHEAEQPWPSGLLTREEIDGLMLGNAGIGWLFLRVADPSLGSVLLPGADILGRT